MPVVVWSGHVQMLLEAADLQAWMARIEHRRGRHVAIVAMARKLAGILYALWRDETCLRAPPPTGA